MWFLTIISIWICLSLAPNTVKDVTFRLCLTSNVGIIYAWLPAPVSAPSPCSAKISSSNVLKWTIFSNGGFGNVVPRKVLQEISFAWWKPFSANLHIYRNICTKKEKESTSQHFTGCSVEISLKWTKSSPSQTWFFTWKKKKQKTGHIQLPARCNHLFPSSPSSCFSFNWLNFQSSTISPLNFRICSFASPNSDSNPISTPVLVSSQPSLIPFNGRKSL